MIPSGRTSAHLNSPFLPMRGLVLFQGRNRRGREHGASSASKPPSEEKMLPEWEEGFVHWERRKLTAAPSTRFLKSPECQIASDLRMYSFHYRCIKKDVSCQLSALLVSIPLLMVSGKRNRSRLVSLYRCITCSKTSINASSQPISPRIIGQTSWKSSFG